MKKRVVQTFTGYLFVLTLLFLNTSLISASSVAQTLYIADNLFVPMRSGQGNEYRIVNSVMRSGTKLTQLDESSDGKWVQVQTTKGTTGWILKQHLSSKMPAKVRLQQTTKQLESAKKQIDNLTQNNANLTRENARLTSQLNQVSSTQTTLNAELDNIKAISGNAINLDAQHRKLIQEHELLRAERDTLAAENTQLSSSNEISFMLYGALLVVLGMILVFIISLFTGKKRSSEWTN